MVHPSMRPISFTYPPVASMWVVTLCNLFLYSDQPVPFHPPSYRFSPFSSQTFFRMNTPTFSNLVVLHIYPPMKMEQTECSETSAYKIQTPGNYPEGSIQHTEHGESLKSRSGWLLTKRRGGVFNACDCIKSKNLDNIWNWIVSENATVAGTLRASVHIYGQSTGKLPFSFLCLRRKHRLWLSISYMFTL